MSVIIYLKILISPENPVNKECLVPKSTADCIYYFVRMSVSVSILVSNSEMQICTENLGKSNNCNCNCNFLNIISFIKLSHARQNIVKSARWSHHNNTAFIKRISLFDAALVITNT